MEDRKRNGWILAAGLLAAGALVGWGFSAWQSRSRTPAALPVAVAPPLTAPGAAKTAAAQPAAPAACAFDPIVASAGSADGKFVLADASQQFSDSAPFLAVAEEAAAAGRPRDAEVALIAACRIASHAGAVSAPVADAQARLANHYAQVGGQQNEGPARVTLLERAEDLLQASFQGYASALGEQSSKTRMAQQRLVAFRQGAIAPPVVAAAAPHSATTATMGAARLSLADRPVRRDENLGEVDQDLQRLYAQARAVTRDPVGLQRRQQQALAARNACRDEDCLRAWYAQRKRQLFAEF